jgi:hypothetical protein
LISTKAIKERRGLGWVCPPSLALAAVAFAVPAAAQPAKVTPAEAVFREGREAAARGDKKTACAKFEESIRLARAPGPILNVADCEESNGRLVSAAKHWQEGIALLDPSDDRLPFAKERAAALDKRIPRLTVRVAPDSRGARVEIDGVLVPPSEIGKPQPVDPGNHNVVATSGESAVRADVIIVEGERKEVTVTLSPPSRDSGPAEKPSSGLRTAGFIAAGVGIAGFAVFGVTAGLLASRSATVEAQCDAQKQCSQEGFDAAESGKAISPVNTAGLIIGIAGVAAGVTLIVVSSKSSSPSSPSSPTATLRATGSPAGFSASLVGTF